MERLKLQLPENFSFSARIPVRITDINYGNHLGNDTFLSLIQEARMQFLGQYGYTELQFAGVGLIMADTAIEFRLEIVYGDIVLIYVTANGFDKLGFDLFYKLTVVRGSDEILAGKAKTGMICYDYALKKRVSIPQEALHKMQAVDGNSADQ